MKIEEALRFNAILHFIETSNLYDNFLYDFDFVETIRLNYDDKTLKYETEFSRYSIYDNLSLYRCYEKWGSFLWKNTAMNLSLGRVIANLYNDHKDCPLIEINRQHRFYLKRYEHDFEKYTKNMKNFLMKVLSQKSLPNEIIDTIHDKVIDAYESEVKTQLRLKMAKYQ